MLEFRELNITPDGKHLIIDVAVKEHDYYNNVIIDSIIIDTQDTYVQNGPSSKPVYQYKVEDDGAHTAMKALITKINSISGLNIANPA